MKRIVVVLLALVALLVGAALVTNYLAGEHLATREEEITVRVAELDDAVPTHRTAIFHPVLLGNGAEHYRALATDQAANVEARARVRAALRSEVIDWRLGATDSDRASFLPASLQTTEFLLAEAEQSDDRDVAIELSLATIAFGYDLQRAGRLPAATIGATLQRRGSKSLARRLERFGLPRQRAADLAERLLRLDGELPLDIAAHFEHEILAVERRLIAQLDGATDAAYGLSGSTAISTPLLYQMMPAYGAKQGAEAYRSTMVRCLDLAETPYPSYEVRMGALNRDHHGDRNIAVTATLTSLTGYRRRLTGARAAVRAAAMLSLAVGERGETGRFPPDAAALVLVAGGALPRDPFTGGVMIYRVEMVEGSPIAIAHSAGADGEPNGQALPEVDPSGVGWFEELGAQAPPILIGLRVRPAPPAP